MISKECRTYITNRGFPIDLVDQIEAPVHALTWDELQTRRKEAVKLRSRMVTDACTEKDKRAPGVTDEVIADGEALMEGLMRSVAREMDARDELGDRSPRNLKSGRRPVDGGQQAEEGDGPVFRDLSTGRVIRGVRHGESFRRGVPGLERPAAPLGEFFRSIALGRPTVPELEDEFRTLITTTTGIPIPTPYAAAMYDLAREQSNVSQAGAIFVPMDSKTLQITKVTADPTAAWKDESTALSASDPTFALVTLTAKTVGILVKVSEETVQDATDFGSKLETVLRGAIGAELDRVALVGSGTGAEPGGIMKSGITANTDVQTYNVGGTPASYDFVSRLVQLVRTANFRPNAMFAHPRTYGTLDRLKDTTNQPLMPPESYKQLTHYPSTRIPIDLENGASPNDGTIAIAGQFSELLIGVRLNPVVHVSRETTDGTDHAFTKYQFHFRIVARIDVQLARGAAFAVGHSIND